MQIHKGQNFEGLQKINKYLSKNHKKSQQQKSKRYQSKTETFPELQKLVHSNK